jgi:hypothetical protein
VAHVVVGDLEIANAKEEPDPSGELTADRLLLRLRDPSDPTKKSMATS